eukprot:CAMPEP_0172440012 /NCGR_PEP_ID=MMETSP1065-20121228/817_1 /TAXON_ID=265537 /ORGANISM="Amphiprora paludosa, Strain CCMP125" /LENGTH=1005 /DNA_ID=CAMNT_0013188789 /DNA_START=254 /DNA_END=3268 /DNA_ORIENTATION=-
MTMDANASSNGVPFEETDSSGNKNGGVTSNGNVNNNNSHQGQDGVAASTMESLGEALAGVNLTAGNGDGAGAAAPSLEGAGTSTGGFHAASNHFAPQDGAAGGNGSGWGNFTDVSTEGNPGPNGNHADGNMGGDEQFQHHNESIQLFLSKDPSQTLGDDVFKLSHGNLTSLSGGTGASEPSPAHPDHQGLSSGDASSAFRLNGHHHHDPSKDAVSPFADMNAQGQPRRRNESPSSATAGTTASTRSVSPTSSSFAAVQEGGGSRTIQAYHHQASYEANDERSIASGSGNNNGGYANATPGSPYNSRVLKPTGGDLDRTGSFQNNYNNPNVVESFSSSSSQPQNSAAAPPANGAAGQVLYMAVQTPDGRGQVLQPVQMVQIPGSKQMAYVVAGPAGSMPVDGAAAPAQVVAPPPQQQPPAPMPQDNGTFGSLGAIGSGALGGGSSPLDGNNNLNRMMNGGNGGGYGADRSYNMNETSSRDEFRSPNSNTGSGGAPFQSDPAIASLYASPQRPPLDSLLGQVRRLSRDQVGCRLVQQALDEEGPMAASLVLQEGLPFWGEAMVDPFGNYLFQKILEKVTPEERVMLVKSVSARLVNASLNLHGTRSVQKVVELCAQDEDNGVLHQNAEGESASDILMDALAPAAARLCIDSHGNHVIQRIILKLGPKYSEFVFDAVANSVGDVARHRHGCCVIQRCLDSPPSEARSHLVHRIVEKALELMQDAYGNYVVQYVLDVCSDEDVHAVCESVVGKVNLLAIQKFSSNVMEKCLERCSERVKEMYMEEMSDAERVRELMMDPFGNYVVQRALSVATHTQAIRLVEAMRPHLVATQTGGPNGQRNGGVRNTAGGRRIIAKICRRFPNFTLTPVVGPTGQPEDIYRRNNSNTGGGHHHQNNNGGGQHHHHHHSPHHGGGGDDLYSRNRHGGDVQQQQQPYNAPIMSYAVGPPQQQQQPQPHYSRAVGQPMQYQQPPQQQPQHQSYYGLGGGAATAASPYYDHFGVNGAIGQGPW